MSVWKVSIAEECKRYPLIKEDDVKRIREWVTLQPHLPTVPDNLIFAFLLSCENSLEACKRTIDLSYTMKTKLPEVFSNRDVNTKWIQTAKKYTQVVVIPPKKPTDTYVAVIRLLPNVSNFFNSEEYFKYVTMVLESSLLEYGAISGMDYVYDLEHFTFGLLVQIPISVISNAVKYSQEGSALAIKGLHFMNGGSVVDKLVSLIKPFLNQKVSQMLKLHDSPESLRKSIDPSILPSDYKGQGPTLVELHERSYSIVKKNQDWFKNEESKFRVDESKRPQGSDCDYGIKGSFRKIAID